MQIEIIALDADDTLWENELLYQEAQTKLRVILSPWDSFQTIDNMLYETEQRNMPLYGYGIKAFTLSMIETAIQVSEGEISGHEISLIMDIAHTMLSAEVELRPYALETLMALSKSHRLMMVTKGDLLDQSVKVKRSGLSSYFSFVEIVNDKTPQAYTDIFQKYNLNPKRFMMVGNSLRSDIQPILELGGKAVYIPADTTWAHETLTEFDGNRRGFYQLEHLGQLPGLIAELTK